MKYVVQNTMHGPEIVEASSPQDAALQFLQETFPLTFSQSCKYVHKCVVFDLNEKVPRAHEYTLTLTAELSERE